MSRLKNIAVHGKLSSSFGQIHDMGREEYPHLWFPANVAAVEAAGYVVPVHTEPTRDLISFVTLYVLRGLDKGGYLKSEFSPIFNAAKKQRRENQSR